MKMFGTIHNKFLGYNLFATDGPAFFTSYNEIIVQEIYKFTENINSSVIIDCPANIGLATLYFKLYYPHAKLITYEPDPKIFAALKKNIAAFSLHDVELFNEAIGDEEAELYFNMEAGHFGKLVNKATATRVAVKVTTLNNVLKNFERIDF